MKTQNRQEYINDQSNSFLTYDQKIVQKTESGKTYSKQLIIGIIVMSVLTIFIISIAFLRDKVQCADPKLEKIIGKMMHRPFSKTFQPHQIYRQYHRATSDAYFGYRLMVFPDNKDYLAAQLYRYDKKYGIGKIKKQQQIELCIISTGYNIKSKQKRVQTYFDSILKQNYSNYHIVYIDDASTDGTTAYAKQYLNKTYPNLINKVKFVLNQHKVEALQNKINGIINYCKNQEIIVDIDSDDALIGRQVFNLLHQSYKQNRNIWMLYTSHIFYHPEFKQPMQGSSDYLSPAMLQSNKQRLLGNFTIMHLRTFRKSIFMKIPQNYWKNQNGNFYQWISDGWIYSALAQISGIERIKFINEVTYFYFRQSQDFNRKQKKQGTLLVRFAHPFEKLSTQESQVKLIENYKITDQQQNKVRKKYEHAYKQIQKQKFIQNKEIQQIINQMKKIPNFNEQKLSKNQGLTSNSMFAFRIMSSPNNKDYYNAVKYLYNKKYAMHEIQKEQHICIYSGNTQNKQDNERFINFIESINRQMYENMTIIYVQLAEVVQNQNQFNYQQYIVNETPRLANKTKFYIIPHTTSLQSKVKIIKQQCKPNSIILQIDHFNQLVGKLSLKLINSLFQKLPNKDILFLSGYQLSNNENPIQSNMITQSELKKFDKKVFSQKINGVLTYRNKLLDLFTDSFWEEGDKYLQQNKLYWNLFGLLQLITPNQIQLCEEIIFYQFKQGLEYKATLKSKKQFDIIKNKQILNSYKKIS